MLRDVSLYQIHANGKTSFRRAHPLKANLHDLNDRPTAKEIRSLAPGEEGCCHIGFVHFRLTQRDFFSVSQSVKEVLQSFVDDNLVWM
jgi:hypothetical protein